MTNSERQKRYRERQKSLRSGGIVTEGVTVVDESVTVEESVTDKMFREDRPGYYVFEEGEPWERECWKCGDRFTTRLELNKFCSPACKDVWLSDAFGKLKSGGGNCGDT